MVATWNVHNQWREGAAVRAAIDEIGADIALTQEAIDLGFLPHFGGFECVRSQGQRIFVRTGDEATDGAGALRIIADGPVTIGESWRLAHEAELEWNGACIRVLNVHLIVSDKHWERNRLGARSPEFFRESERVRALQMNAIARWVQQQDGPWIVAGDFNTPPGAPVLRALQSTGRDVFGERGIGFGHTYKDDVPLWRIDYIWVSRHLQVLRAGNFGGGVSDHRGVWTQIALHSEGNEAEQ
jgi:endonuclease/exonuclease/phosphatase family metal-dependent hydrolase